MAGDVLTRAPVRLGFGTLVGASLGSTLVGLMLAGCDRPTPGRAAASTDVEVDPALYASARRPAQTFVMERTGERCEVFVFENGEIVARLPQRPGGPASSAGVGDGEGAPKKYACPRELELGEKIRIVGTTCARESPVPERNLPTICPDYLTNAERDWRKAHAAPTGSASAR